MTVEVKTQAEYEATLEKLNEITEEQEKMEDLTVEEKA